MALAEYQKKRHFRITPEPAGRIARSAGWLYVIQKHAASHLHYDFRLEFAGVLKSWAIPKGPSLDPSIKRLAMQVEDHPVDYGGFEGVIPAGEYGGGTVLLWDQGIWEPIGDPATGFRQGKLKFHLLGQKLHGTWNLIRTRRTDSGKAIPWLLIKERDSAAKTHGDILKQSPLSVASGRNLDEIAAAQERTWSRNGEIARKTKEKKSVSSGTPPRTRPKTSSPSSRNQRLPAVVDVQLATLAKEAPSGEEWLHEIKYDGYRMICRIDGGRVKFISRNHQDWTSRVGAPLIQAARGIAAKQALLDGEIVVLQADGTTDFQSLQNAFRDERDQDLQYFVFDVLHLDGKILADLPLIERKAILAHLLSDVRPDSPIHYAEHVTGQGEEFQKQACRLHLEGSVSKRRAEPYRPGRGTDWLKVKCVHKDEFVIGGFTEPAGSRIGFGALLMGSYDDRHQLRYAGKVGTGFDERELNSLYQRLRSLEQEKSPFSDRKNKTGDIRKAHWVQPRLVAQITFDSRTREGILRHAVFAGLREDKPAEDVKLEQTVAVDIPARKPRNSRRLNSSAANGKSGKTSLKNASPTSPSPADSNYDSHTTETLDGVRLTHPGKALYPEENITKLELAQYYRDVADWILPHLTHRPIVLVRCPDGRRKECFYQKHPCKGTAAVLRQIPIRESKTTEKYLVVDDVQGLIALVQIGSLEIHAWGAREDKLEQPDRLIFDLDPSPEVPWPRVVESARQIREFLQDIGLESFVKTTGGKGLHLVVPIDRRHDWDQVKRFCHDVAKSIVAAAPDRYTSTLSKAARTNKIFIDYLRNGRGATAVVPYSTRARPNAPVSTPLSWNELCPAIRSDQFTVRNLRDRLAKLRADPWKSMTEFRQSLAGPMKKLRSISHNR